MKKKTLNSISREIVYENNVVCCKREAAVKHPEGAAKNVANGERLQRKIITAPTLNSF